MAAADLETSVRRLYANNQRERVVSLLEETVASRPDNLAARALLSMAYSDTKRSGRALEEANAIIELDPMSSYGHTALGYCYWYRGTLDEAEASLRRGVDLYRGPAGPNPSERLAQLLSQRNDIEAAIAVAESALEKHPNDVVMVQSRLRLAGEAKDRRAVRSLSYRLFRLSPSPVTFFSWINNAMRPVRIDGTVLLGFLIVSRWLLLEIHASWHLQMRQLLWVVSSLMIVWIWFAELTNLIWRRVSLSVFRLLWSSAALYFLVIGPPLYGRIFG